MHRSPTVRRWFIILAIVVVVTSFWTFATHSTKHAHANKLPAVATAKLPDFVLPPDSRPLPSPPAPRYDTDPARTCAGAEPADAVNVAEQAARLVGSFPSRNKTTALLSELKAYVLPAFYSKTSASWKATKIVRTYSVSATTTACRLGRRIQDLQIFTITVHVVTESAVDLSKGSVDLDYDVPVIQLGDGQTFRAVGVYSPGYLGEEGGE